MAKAVEFNLATREFGVIPFEDIPPDGPKEVIYWIHLDIDETFPERIIELGAPPDEVAKFVDGEVQPQMSEEEGGLFIALPYWAPGRGEDRNDRLVIFLTDRFCLTACASPLPCISEFDHSYRLEFRYAASPGFILFLVLEFLIEDFGSMVSQLDVECERIDERIHGGVEPQLNRDILALKRRVLVFKRVVGHTRSIVSRIAGRRIGVVTDACRESMGEVSGQAQAVLTSADSLRDMLDSSFDSYRSELAQRLNEIMKVLTMVSLAMLPMTLIAGIYGMNFQSMPELGWAMGYPMAIGLMVASGVTLLYFFKRRGWL
ncbi:MAG: magnesium transporter CorA family protein [Planctomycetota bacterium]